MASLSLRGIYKRYPGGVVAVSDFTMRESNIVNMKGVFSNGKFIFKECLQSIS